MTDQQTMQINPVAALRAASGRLDALDAYYINRVKILENDKLTLEARVAELEAQLAPQSAEQDEEITHPRTDGKKVTALL